MFHSVWLAGCEHHLFSIAKDNHAFWKQELRLFSKKGVSYFRKLWPEKNFWDYQTVALSAQSAGTSCEPHQCCPRSRLEQPILVCGFPGRQIYLGRQLVVCRAEAVRIHPSAGADAGQGAVSRRWRMLGTRHSLAELELLAGSGCLPWPSCSSGAGAEQTLLGLSLPVSGFTDILQWLSIFSSVTADCVSFSRRTFVPWWKGSGLPWGTGLGAASCLWLHPILAMW